MVFLFPDQTTFSRCDSEPMDPQVKRENKRDRPTELSMMVPASDFASPFYGKISPVDTGELCYRYIRQCGMPSEHRGDSNPGKKRRDADTAKICQMQPWTAKDFKHIAELTCRTGNISSERIYYFHARGVLLLGCLCETSLRYDQRKREAQPNAGRLALACSSLVNCTN